METIQLVLKQIADKPKNDSLKFTPKIPYLTLVRDKKIFIHHRKEASVGSS